MSEEKKKRNKIIGISIGILVVLLVVISSTYAYWQITKSQKDPNKIISACLDFDVDFPVGITEENKWPMSSSEAMSTIEGYTFTVTNKCPEDVTYVIGLESVTSDNITSYLSDASVGIGFDGVNKGTYSSLTDLEGPTANARESKKLQTAIVKGKSDIEGENVNTHNLKLWIDESSDVEEQSKGFSGKLFITGGQKVPHDLPNPLTAASCFEMSGEEIIGYKEELPECDESVVIPASVNGTPVTTIDTYAFKTKTLEDQITYNIGYTSTEDADYSMVVDEGLLQGTGTDAYYFVVYNDTDVVQSRITNWKSQANALGITHEIPIYYEGQDEIPLLEEGQEQIYFKTHSEGEDKIAFKTPIIKYVVSIKSLDLSQAYNLEKIEERAFTNVTAERSEISGDKKFLEVASATPVSLTSLTFGNNSKNISIGSLAFARIDVDNLITYASYVPYNESDSTIYDSSFLAADIDNLTVKPSDSDNIIKIGDFSSYYGSLYIYAYYKNVNIAEGIEAIDKYVFSGNFVENSYHNANSLNLPDSLKTIGEAAFYNIPFNVVNLGTGLSNIGESAFYGMAESQVINVPMAQSAFETQVTRGSYWSGNATINYAS